MNESEKVIKCIYCQSDRVIRHGKTSNGNLRFRCNNCNRTWVAEKKLVQRPHISELVEQYLDGKSYRELVGMYHSSPLRLNQKIRDYLQNVPSWETYLDTVVNNHDFPIIYLTEKSFSSINKDSKKNQLHLAMAVDALSSVVIGYEVSNNSNKNLWLSLLDRINCRGVKTSVFMSSGWDHIDDSIRAIFPDAQIKINYHRINRDSEITCCLSKNHVNTKLINDAISAYENLRNQNLNNLLVKNYSKTFKDIVLENQQLFSYRLQRRLENNHNNRIEGLTTAFQNRFEKFHMLKDDPLPLINGWITKWMISTLEHGFSRLSLYLQSPVKISFQNYAIGNLPEPVIYPEDHPQLHSFVIELAARALQMPTFISSCEMKIEQCSLFLL